MLVRIFLKHQNIDFQRCVCSRKFHISALHSEYITDEHDNVAAPCEPPINAWHRRQLVQFLRYVAIGYEWFLSLNPVNSNLEEPQQLSPLNSPVISCWSYFPYSHNNYRHLANSQLILALSISLSISTIDFFLLTLDTK